MAEGRITRIVADRRFFFIDDDYWCHFNNYDRMPEENHIVEYTPETRSDGKKNAVNVRFLKTVKNPFDEYLAEVDNGYFNESGAIDKEFLIDYPKFLVNEFRKNRNVNKTSQIRRYFDHIRLIEGKYKFHKNFELTKGDLYKLVSIANKSMTKNNLSESFFKFFDKNIETACRDSKSFLYGFIPHFQAIIGFYGE